jgi:mRNA interferase MazF
MRHDRGAVVMVNLEPVMGSEQGRVRPCIVVSDLGTITASHSRPLYVIVPLTRSEKLVGPLAPRLKARRGALPADSAALGMHLRSIDPRRITGRVGKLNAHEFDKLEEGIKQLFTL